MKKCAPFLLPLCLILLFGNCAGIRYITIDTREPSRIDWSPSVASVVVVNNTVQQPDHIGHDISLPGQPVQRIRASSDGIATIYMQALAQFIDEEEFFDRVLFYHPPLRTDTYFFEEIPLSLSTIATVLRESGADAIISLDQLIIQTGSRLSLVEPLRSMELNLEGFPPRAMQVEITTRITSSIRVYTPMLAGVIPTVQYSDSLVFRALAWSDQDFIELREYAMRQLVIHAAERMSRVLSPHWETQDRWFYTTMGARMREGVAFARGGQWENALERWLLSYTSARRIEKAKAASNVALAYEMLDDLENALAWATRAHQLFEQHTSTNSLDRRRSLLFKNELQRRLAVVERLRNMLEE